MLWLVYTILQSALADSALTLDNVDVLADLADSNTTPTKMN